jgi:hypothetical protein
MAGLSAGTPSFAKHGFDPVGTERFRGDARMRQLSRRQFLSGMARLGGAASAFLIYGSSHAQSSPPRPPSNLRIGTSTKALLTQQDLQYVGAFLWPDSQNSPVRCLTGRYVGAELHLLTTLPYGYGQDVLEFKVPTLSTGAIPGSLNSASLVNRWASEVTSTTGLYHLANGAWGKWYGNTSTGWDNWTWPKALYWDPVDSRLYWMFGFNATDDYMGANWIDDTCTFGASTLNDSTGVGQALGSWRVPYTQIGQKALNSGMLPIPTAFANAYLGGKRLSLGFGGYRSSMTAGGTSMGPSLAAIDPPSPANHKGSVPATVMLYYPYLDNGHAYYPDLIHPVRPHRDTDYTESYDNPPWNPTGGFGFWDWRATYLGCMVWVDTPTKYGLFFFSPLGQGYGWYDCVPGCSGKSMGYADTAFVWDPNDLIPVIQGSAQTWWPQPHSWWRMPLASGSQRYTDVANAVIGQSPPYEGMNWDYEPSLWFDPATNKLYIAMFEPGVRPPGGGGGLSLCYVYQVA